MGFENLNINEDPSLQANYERFRGCLDDDLAKISPADLKPEIDKAWEDAGNDIFDSDTKDRFYDLRQTLESIQRLMSIQNKDELLEKMARKDLHMLNAAEQASGALPDSIRDTVFHLHQTCSYLAQWKFKDEFNGQIDSSLESKKDDIEKRRDELGRMNVS